MNEFKVNISGSDAEYINIVKQRRSPALSNEDFVFLCVNAIDGLADAVDVLLSFKHELIDMTKGGEGDDR